MNFIKRLNWTGWLATYLLCIGASFERENENIKHSLIIGLVLGFIFSLFPLFAVIKPKSKNSKTK